MRSLASLASRSAGPLAAFALAALVQTGCGAARQSTSGAPRAPAASAASGHDLVVQATSCWMGGLWSDALGETGADRLAGIERRCDALLREVDLTQRERARAEAEQLPPPAPDEAYFPLRAVERHVVDALADEVRARAERDPREAASARELVTLLYATADAARETIHARRAADAVKEDVASQPSVAARNVDKAAAAPKLRSGQALDRLFTLQCGRYTPEARAIGLLVALDRMEIARGLPKHLKVYAVDRAYADVFGVQAPPVDDDAPAPIRSGTWLAY
ncbi:MAG TPA: hypothetical protein VE987_06685, partial [Polyangiaceae bacterium]|nr:hypothetical protein [Polyangiaceae bacterium]